MGVATRICIRRILYATDFSPESVQAIPYVRELQRRYHANVDVVHVLDVFPVPSAPDPECLARIDAIRKAGNARMQEFMQTHGFGGREFQSVLVTGEVSLAVDRFVREQQVDLIVLGSHGDVGINRLFQGSTAEEIFRTAECPVMVVGPGARFFEDQGSFRHLFFPTDLGPFSKAALPYVEFMLREDGRAKVTLAHFLEQAPETPYQRHKTRRYVERELAALIAPELRQQIEDIAVEFCAPAEGMIGLAAGLGADLLLLGVRQGGAFVRAATHGLRSITHRVISQSPCPVLTVRGS